MRYELSARRNSCQCEVRYVEATSGILEEIRESQKTDLGLMERWVLINQGKSMEFKIDENGVMIFEIEFVFQVC